ncbi:DUF3558 domain-containing protein [Actinophytocola sp. KF-1]
MWPSVLLVVFVAGGCTSTSEGSPQPVPERPTSDTSTTTTSTESGGAGEDALPYAGAPAVRDPLDTEQFQQDPCRALTTTQTDALNVGSPGLLRDGGLGMACEFRGRADRGALVEVASLDENPRGVSAIYRAEEDGKLAFFEPMDPVEGYPAVAYGVLDYRKDGECSVVIGTSDEIAFEIVLHLSSKNVGKKDPCDTAAMVAGKVLQTMKAAQ